MLLVVFCSALTFSAEGFSFFSAILDTSGFWVLDSVSAGFDFLGVALSFSMACRTVEYTLV